MVDNDKLKTVSRLKLECISSRGMYYDPSGPTMFKMDNEMIALARQYFHNPNIAKDIIIPAEDYKPKVSHSYKSKQADYIHVQEKPVKPVNTRVNSSTTGRPYAVKRENKYSNKQMKMKNNVFFRRAMVTGIAVFICIGSFNVVNNLNKNAEFKEVPSVSVETTMSRLEESEPDIVSARPVIDEPVEVQEVGPEIEESVKAPEEFVEVEESEMRTLVNHYADVYHLNRDKAYDRLAGLTANFTSDEYIDNMRITGLSCKGTDIYPTSEEELVIYYMRILSQEPKRYGFNDGELSKDANIAYKSGTDYSTMIAHYCEVMGEDPCLIYAIIQAETGWVSEALVGLNNPCGLMINDKLWKFDSFESGLIETIAQVKQYRLKGANTIAQIGAIHCPVGVSNDPYGLNNNWVGNVTSIYNKAFANQEALFGKVMVGEKNKTLG